MICPAGCDVELEQVAYYWICPECQRGFNRYGWLVFHGPKHGPGDA